MTKMLQLTRSECLGQFLFSFFNGEYSYCTFNLGKCSSLQLSKTYWNGKSNEYGFNPTEVLIGISDSDTSINILIGSNRGSNRNISFGSVIHSADLISSVGTKIWSLTAFLYMTKNIGVPVLPVKYLFL